MPLLRYLRRCARKFAPLDDPPELLARKRKRSWKRHALIWRLALRDYARSWVPARPPLDLPPPPDADAQHEQHEQDGAESPDEQATPQSKAEAEAQQAEELKRVLQDNAQLFKVTLGEFFRGYQEGKEERRVEAEREAAEAQQQPPQATDDDDDNKR